MSDEEEESSSKWVSVEEEDEEDEEDDDHDDSSDDDDNNTNNNEKQQPAPTTTTAAAKKTLKDLINVTNFATDVEDDDPDNYDSVIKVVDGETVFQQQQQQQDATTTGSSGTESSTNPFQKVMDQTVTSIRRSMTEHVTPKIESFVQDTQHGIQKIGDTVRSVNQQHVVPIATKANQGLQEFQKSTKQGLDEFGQSTKQTFDKFQQDTKQVVDRHVVPHVQHVQQVSNRKFSELETSSREFTTKHINPQIQQFQRVTNSTYQSTTTFIYNNRQYFWNSAPGLASTCRSSSSSPDVVDGGEGGGESGSGRRLDYGYNYNSSWKQLYLLLEESTARSFGQVVFCNNPITGLFVWFAMLLSSSPFAALCSLVCVGTVRTFVSLLFLCCWFVLRFVLRYTTCSLGFLVSLSVCVCVCVCLCVFDDNDIVGKLTILFSCSLLCLCSRRT